MHNYYLYKMSSGNFINPTIDELKNDIKRHNLSLERYSDDHQRYSLKADSLMKLAKISDKKYYNNALDAINKAITLFPKYSYYLIQRCKCYIAMKPTNWNLVSAELALIKDFSKTGDLLYDTYIANKIKEIEELKLKN